MKREEFINEDVEQILRELAEEDRCLMDDSMSERILSIIDNEVEYSYRKRIYKKTTQCAAALLLTGVCVTILFNVSNDTVTVVTETPVGRDKPHSDQLNKKRALLSYLDSTMESGFSPVPHETYDGETNRKYGVSLYAEYEYTVCTDTL